jgi:hypothetical protein
MWALPGVTRASPSPKKKRETTMKIAFELDLEQLAIALVILHTLL